MKALFSIASVAVLMWGSTVSATERPDHFKGLASPTWEVAVKNLTDHNVQLADLVNKDELSATDLAKVHELTYTLENALERMEEELESVAETLENVHVASETNDPKTVQEQGKKYLSDSDAILR